MSMMSMIPIPSPLAEPPSASPRCLVCANDLAASLSHWKMTPRMDGISTDASVRHYGCAYINIVFTFIVPSRRVYYESSTHGYNEQGLYDAAGVYNLAAATFEFGFASIGLATMVARMAIFAPEKSFAIHTTTLFPHPSSQISASPFDHRSPTAVIVHVSTTSDLHARSAPSRTTPTTKHHSDVDDPNK
ncbi:hypothetical protein BDZ89DRAFT_1136800 [Hymenopellis radicata]|nr:hypothetical protein BDZ89DRAFT_1136800 [Hymenopellis radicata]